MTDNEWHEEAEFQALVAEALAHPDDIDCLLPCTQDEDPELLCQFTGEPTCVACRIRTARLVAEEWMDENQD